MEAHSILAPSGSGVWVRCSGMPRFVRGLPSHIREVHDSAEQAKDGTKMHALGYDLLRGSTDNAEQYADLDDDLAAMAADYAATVRSFEGPETLSYYEQRLEIPRIHPECFGTPDCAMFHRDTCTVDMFDLKGGHRIVDPFELWQLIAYFCGFFDKLKTEGQVVTDTNLVVRLHIYQPRAYDGQPPLRTWETTAEKLRGKINQLEHAAHEAMSDRAKLVPGRHCWDCPGRTSCPASQTMAASLVEYAHGLEYRALDPEQLGRSLQDAADAVEMLQRYIVAAEAEASALLDGGTQVAGYTKKPGRGRTIWNPEKSGDLEAVASALGVDIEKPRAYVTPAQAKKAGLPAALVDKLVTFVPGEMKLARIDPRNAKKVFAND